MRFLYYRRTCISTIFQLVNNLHRIRLFPKVTVTIFFTSSLQSCPINLRFASLPQISQRATPSIIRKFLCLKNFSRAGQTMVRKLHFETACFLTLGTLDLLSLLAEVNGDVQVAATRITDGIVFLSLSNRIRIEKILNRPRGTMGLSKP